MTEPCKFEKEIIQMSQDVAVIKDNTSRSDKFWLALIGIAATVILEIVFFSNTFGRLENSVAQHERGIMRLESVVFAAQEGKGK